MAQLISFLPWIAVLVIFYAILIIPENKRKKKYNAMLSALEVNDEVVTRGGIIGKVVNIQDDYVIVQSGPDKARIKITKNGISNVLTEKEEKNDEKSEEKIDKKADK